MGDWPNFPDVPAARVFNVAAISISNSTTTALTFDSELFDTDELHDTSTNTSRLTCRTPGIYLIWASVGFASNASGIRQVHILLNNGTIVVATDSRDSHGLGVNAFSISGLAELAPGDYAECRVYQQSGAALNIEANPKFGMARVA